MKNMKVIVVKHNEWHRYSGYRTTENPKIEGDPQNYLKKKYLYIVRENE